MRTCAVINIHYCPYALPRCLHHDLQTHSIRLMGLASSLSCLSGRKRCNKYNCWDSHQPHSTCKCKKSHKSLLQLNLRYSATWPAQLMCHELTCMPTSSCT